MERKNMMTTLGICADAAYNLVECQEKFEIAYDENEKFLQMVEKIRTKFTLRGCTWLIFIGSLILTGWLIMRVGTIFYSILGVWIPDTLSIVIAAAISLLLAIKAATSDKAKRNAQADEYIKNNLPVVKKKLEDAQSAMEELVNSDEVRVLRETIPEDYATLDAIAFFISAFKNLRVDTLKEAINLYEEEKYRREMQDMQIQELELLVQSVEIAREQLDVQKSILNLQRQSVRVQNRTLDKTKQLSRQARFSNAFTVINTVRHWKK